MKYQEPDMEIVWFDGSNIVRTSTIGNDGSGSGPSIGGDGSQPWE